MLPDLLDSFLRPASYRRFAVEKAARTARYVAFLSLIYAGGIGISVKLHLAPMFAETFAWLQTSMPTLKFAPGGVTSSATGPLRLEHPKYKEISVMIDTARKDAVTARQMTDAKVMAYLTGTALYLKRDSESGAPELETIDLTKSSAEQAVTVDASSYKDLEKAFNRIFYPLLMLLFFLMFSFALAFVGLVYAVIGMIFAALSGGSLEFAPLFRLGVHAQTAGSLLYALPLSVPFYPALSIAASLTFLWLGVRACVKAAPAEPPRPAA
jgi:hypothetical protein